MTIYTNSIGITCIKADDGKAICRASEDGPSTVTSVSLGRDEPQTNWKDCDFGQTDQPQI